MLLNLGVAEERIKNAQENLAHAANEISLLKAKLPPKATVIPTAARKRLIRDVQALCREQRLDYKRVWGFLYDRLFERTGIAVRKESIANECESRLDYLQGCDKIGVVRQILQDSLPGILILKGKQ